MLTSAPAGGALAANDAPQGIGPGFVGFVVIFLLAVACYLLFRSMVGHLRKVRYSPDPNRPETPEREEPEHDRPEHDRPKQERTGHDKPAEGAGESTGPAQPRRAEPTAPAGNSSTS